MKSALVLRGRTGLGDAIYLRPIVREASERFDLYLETCWPQLYSDLTVRYVKPRPKTRDPQRNVATAPQPDYAHPRARERSAHYRWSGLRQFGMLAELEKLSGVHLESPFFDLPPLPGSPVQAERIAVVRPVTLRREWPNPARNPEPTYITGASAILQDAGFHVVAVANAHPTQEPIIGPVVAAERFEAGELGILDLLALVRAATVVVGGPGWIVPACLATRTPLVVIAGGQGGVNSPEALVDRRVDSRHVHWLLPDKYCRCTNKQHTCPKEISFFADRFGSASEEVACVSF